MKNQIKFVVDMGVLGPDAKLDLDEGDSYGEDAYCANWREVRVALRYARRNSFTILKIHRR